jgi:hypothetical protein
VVENVKVSRREFHQFSPSSTLFQRKLFEIVYSNDEETEIHR